MPKPSAVPTREDNPIVRAVPVGSVAPGPAAGPLPDEAADRLAAAVLGCPQIVALSGGRDGEIATYLPGRRVTGVRLTDTGVVVHVVAAYGPTCAQIAGQVRRAVHAAVGPVPVTVGIDDVDLTRTGLYP